MQSSLVLLSGGLDSMTALAIAKDKGWNPTIALSVFYGQRHAKELKSAAGIAWHYDLQHIILEAPSLGEVIKSGSALVNSAETLPAARSVEEMPNSIPRSYVPGRNTILLALAQSVAETFGCDRIVCGFNAVDYSGYPDCRPEFVARWNALANVATAKGVEGNPITVLAPIIDLTKIDIVKEALRLNAPLHLSWSCYYGGSSVCGTCDSCLIRSQAFEKAGVLDPAI